MPRAAPIPHHACHTHLFGTRLGAVATMAEALQVVSCIGAATFTREDVVNLFGQAETCRVVPAQGFLASDLLTEGLPRLRLIEVNPASVLARYLGLAGAAV